MLMWTQVGMTWTDWTSLMATSTANGFKIEEIKYCLIILQKHKEL